MMCCGFDFLERRVGSDFWAFHIKSGRRIPEKKRFNGRYAIEAAAHLKALHPDLPTKSYFGNSIEWPCKRVALFAIVFQLLNWQA